MGSLCGPILRNNNQFFTIIVITDQARFFAICIYLLALDCLPFALAASIPEPANVIYGDVTIGQMQATADDTRVVVSLKVNDTILASYRMGDKAGMGDQ